jgi:hypothetical protein
MIAMLAGDDCASERMRKSRPVLAVNERPAIAAVAIGHREDPVAVTPQLAAPVAAIPEPPQDASVVPVDVAPATDSLPTPVAKHSRTSSRPDVLRCGISNRPMSARGPGLFRAYVSSGQLRTCGRMSLGP